MLTTRALLLPSVPTMLIDEQRGDFTEMIEAVTAAGERLASEKPDALVALSARWVSAGPFHADDAAQHRSVIDLPGFGVEPRYDCPGSPALARALVDGATRAGVRAASARPERIAFVVGGALAFNLHAFNLRRDLEEARELDERVLESMRLGKWSAL